MKNNINIDKNNLRIFSKFLEISPKKNLLSAVNLKKRRILSTLIILNSFVNPIYTDVGGRTAIKTVGRIATKSTIE